MEYLKNSKIEVDKWKDLVRNCKLSTPFQTHEFFEFYNSIEQQSANVYAIGTGDRLLGLAIVTIQKEKGVKRFFSKRGIIYGGCLLEDEVDGQGVYNQLLKYVAEDLRNEVIYIEIRNYLDYSHIEINDIWQRIPYYNCNIDLRGKTIDDLLKAMTYNRRREIKLSFKEGADVEEAKSLDDVLILYNLLKELYKDRVKLPLPNESFFKNFYHSGIGKVFVVKHEDNIIGGAFCLFYAGLSIYTYYYHGIRDYHPKIFPTHLAIYGAMKFGIDNKLQMVDLMGAGKPEEEYGVRKYKAAYGSNLIEQDRFLLIQKPLLYKLGLKGLQFLKRFK